MNVLTLVLVLILIISCFRGLVTSDLVQKVFILYSVHGRFCIGSKNLVTVTVSDKSV